MKILVCIARTPDTTTKVAFKDDRKTLAGDNIQYIINPLDEFALTRALEIKEAAGGQVTVIHAGPADSEPVIRKALAIGADEAVRIDTPADDSYDVAAQIANYARQENFDMILAGRETIDFNGSQVGGMIAEMLSIPFISGVSRLEVNGQEAMMDREIEGGKEIVSVKLPFTASVQEGIAVPRIPNMRGIMSARTKPLKVVAPAGAEKLTGTERFELPPARSACRMVDASRPEELAELLNKEAKVI